ncbi:MAG: ROK family protein [Chloroflexi bacterium]|nr:ROK family protein [Chloroflexota bacterium]
MASATSTGPWLGIDIGGTKTALGIVDATGHVLAEDRLSTLVGSRANDGLANLIAHARRLVDAFSDVQGIGVGICCQVDPLEGTVQGADTAIPGWDSFVLPEILTTAMRRPTAIDNDANVALLGEVWWGAARGCTDVVLMTIGTGIGGGILTGGRVVAGSRGGAGEIGHIMVAPTGPRCTCGSRGCLEAMISGSALANRAYALGLASPAELFAAAGYHPGAQREVNRAGQLLCRAVLALVNTLQPEVVLFGGGVISSASPFWIPMVKSAIGTRTFPSNRAVRIERVAFGEQAGVVGAAALIRSRLSPEP